MKTLLVSCLFSLLLSGVLVLSFELSRVGKDINVVGHRIDECSVLFTVMDYYLKSGNTKADISDLYKKCIGILGVDRSDKEIAICKKKIFGSNEVSRSSEKYPLFIECLDPPNYVR